MEACASRPVLGFRTGGRTHNHILALGNVLPLAEKRSGQFSLHIPAVLEAPLVHFHTHALHHRFCIATRNATLTLGFNSALFLSEPAALSGVFFSEAPTHVPKLAAFAALFEAPRDPLRRLVEERRRLVCGGDAACDYSAAHLRRLEGHCERTISRGCNATARHAAGLLPPPRVDILRAIADVRGAPPAVAQARLTALEAEVEREHEARKLAWAEGAPGGASTCLDTWAGACGMRSPHVRASLRRGGCPAPLYLADDRQHPPDSRRLVTEFGALACYGSLDHKQNSRKPLPPALRQQWSDLVVALRARSAATANCTGGSAQLALLADLLMLTGARCRLPNPASSMDHVARYIAEARARPQT